MLKFYSVTSLLRVDPLRVTTPTSGLLLIFIIRRLYNQTSNSLFFFDFILLSRRHASAF
jgi:hypothetical protein